MAIEYNNASSGNADDDPLTFSHTVNAGDNRILIVGTGLECNSAAEHHVVTSITYDGNALTKIAHQDYEDRNRTELWYLLAPDVKTADIVVTLEAGLIVGITAGAITINGAKQQAPEANASASGSGTSATVDITTITNNAWIIDVVSNSSSSTDQVAEGTQTERWEDSNDQRNNGSTKPFVTAGETSVTWTLAASKTWGIIAASFEVEGAAPPATGFMTANKYWG